MMSVIIFQGGGSSDVMAILMETDVRCVPLNIECAFGDAKSVTTFIITFYSVGVDKNGCYGWSL